MTHLMHKVQVHGMISSYVQIDIAEEKGPIPTCFTRVTHVCDRVMYRTMTL